MSLDPLHSSPRRSLVGVNCGTARRQQGIGLAAGKAAKAQLAVAVSAEASAQVEDDVINEEEEREGQYAAIKINYETEVIGEE